MFFSNRRHALRVIERMGLSAKSPEAAVLVDMMVTGAKQYAQMFPAVKISKCERVLWSVAAMTDNATAYARLARDLRAPQERVNELMSRARAAGHSLAIAEGLIEMVRRIYDPLRPIGQFTTGDDDRAWAVNDFREKRREVEASDETRRMAFSIALALEWKSFLATHGSPDAFARLPRERQMDYYKKSLVVAKGLAATDREAGLAHLITCHYLGALINGDKEFEAEASQFLDPHARRGWDFASALGR